MSKLTILLTHLAAAVLVAAVLVAVGQPIITDDLWWHLALGESYANQGPWLEQDPLLFTATRPPTPAAWLSDVLLYGVQTHFGFAGLRIAHVLLAAAIFALAWGLLRRAAGSAALASCGVTIFATLCAFRVFQLRPHLFTLLAALLLVHWLFARPEVPSRLRVGATVGLFALWANLHNGFLLGPILLAAGLGGVCVAALIGPEAQRAAQRSRAAVLAIALGLGALATLANPSGWEPHLAYFSAGEESPALALVGDEWAPFRPFEFPASPLPPAPLEWLLIWGLLLSTPLVALWLLRGRDEAEARIDYAWIALALVSLPAMVVAVRFAWLGIFPLLLFAGALGWRGRDGGMRASQQGATLLATAAVTTAFFFVGSWPALSGAIPRDPSVYVESDYPAAKWFSHGVWFLKDTGVEGNVFNDYFMGGYLGFWLTPELKVFQNGTLNVPISAHQAMRALRSRTGLENGPGFEALLDQYRIDLVFGIRLPEQLSGPWHYTTALMERSSGWLPVFRDLRSSIWLRNDARNQANLERIARYYAEADVPFDRETGFDVWRVLREAPDWALAHGLVPVHFDQLASGTQSPHLDVAARSSIELARVYGALGLYEDALQLDDRALRLRPQSASAQRHRLWTLMRLDRRDELRAALAESEAQERPGRALQRVIDDATRYAELEDPEQAVAVSALSTVLTPGEARRLRGYARPPEARRR